MLRSSSGRRPIHKLVTASPREWGDLVRAQWHLLVSWAALALRPRGGLVRRAEAGESAQGTVREEQLHRIGLAVDRVARFGLVRPTCLVRAMALERMIEKAGGGATVRVGIRHVEAGFGAHAWIELNGRIIGDQPAFVKQFTPLVDITALPR